jgi:hypothetical protein
LLLEENREIRIDDVAQRNAFAAQHGSAPDAIRIIIAPG